MMNSVHRELILVGGNPGTGKTTIGRLLAQALGYGLVDKDSATCAMTEGILKALGRDKNDRESESYARHVKPLEYETILNIVRDNLDIGHSMICTAPFTSLFRDPQWIGRMETLASTSAARLSLIWMTADASATRARIIHRAADMDKWKIEFWQEYRASLPVEPPSHERIILADNTLDNNMDNVVRSILDKLESRNSMLV